MSKKEFGVFDAIKSVNLVSAGSTAVRTVVSATADEKRCPKCGKMTKQDLTCTKAFGKACSGGATVGVLAATGGAAISSGAAAGAAIGSVIPVFGTIIGGLIGGAIGAATAGGTAAAVGGAAGSVVGRAVDEGAKSYKCPNCKYEFF